MPVTKQNRMDRFTASERVAGDNRSIASGVTVISTDFPIPNEESGTPAVHRTFRWDSQATNRAPLLPPLAVQGESITLYRFGIGDAKTLTMARNGHTIGGVAADLLVAAASLKGSVTLVAQGTGAAVDWEIANFA
jgi:hypothetical protein